MKGQTGLSTETLPALQRFGEKATTFFTAVASKIPHCFPASLAVLKAVIDVSARMRAVVSWNALPNSEHYEFPFLLLFSSLFGSDVKNTSSQRKFQFSFDYSESGRPSACRRFSQTECTAANACSNLILHLDKQYRFKKFASTALWSSGESSLILI